MRTLLKGLLLFAAISWCPVMVAQASSNPFDDASAAVHAKVREDCAFPSAARVMQDQDGSLLKTWRFEGAAQYGAPSLPNDPDLLEYRRYIASLGVDARSPPLKVPADVGAEERKIWDAEIRNNESISRLGIGVVEPIACLDALLFAEQHRRVSQIDTPTEFIAHVLSRGRHGSQELFVVFGAGLGMFPPKSVYGLELVQDAIRDGWEYRYMLHNHTLQGDRDAPVPGVPAPSTTDIGFARELANHYGLKAMRVTNGVYTFSASIAELNELDAR